MTTDQLIDDLADLLVPRLVERGFIREEGGVPGAVVTAAYDEGTCRQFLEGRHLGDSVLKRAEVFFEALANDGDITSVGLAAALQLKGPKSLPANLTNPLKKSARRLRIEEPWEVAETADGSRTIWRDRDGIAARMVEQIEEEWGRREPSPWNPVRPG